MHRWLLFLLLTVRCFGHGDLHERIIAISGQLQTNASNPDLWLLRADLQRQHGDFESARRDLDHVSQLRPNWPRTDLQRARISFDEENFRECARAAGDCLRRDFANADALVLRARSLVRLNEPAAAVTDYNAVLNRTNAAVPLPDLYLERARALAMLQRWDDALRGLDDGMNRLGATPSLALPAIEYERERKGFARALERLERAKGFFHPQQYAKLRDEILRQLKQP